ncbi:PREDICTED: selenoprotein P-like [Branchiostoma belcheri]|uniref:Selenoprotein P-like n=1 Tax=Branchiostoma belcheri TaxID=7741 RepID=A0A6P4ZZ65_BRABE|nr:PREDICTED: selenoprotein P-like [Branchiostoma belcheri]
MTDRGGLLLAALCLVVSGLGALAAPNEQCSQPPSWQLDGIDFMEESRGKVVVLQILERLRLELQADGVTDVSFGVINGKGFISKLHLRELEGKVNFGVYQDTARANVWRLLGGKKDDFIIYDRCGRLAKHIRMPEAYLRRPDVEDAIREVYAGGPCGYCAAYPGPETTPRPALTTPAAGLLTSGPVLTMASDIGSGDLDEEFILNVMSDADVSDTPLPTSTSPQNGTSVDKVTKSVMFREHNNTESQQRNITRHHRRHHNHRHRGDRDRSHQQKSQDEDTAN